MSLSTSAYTATTSKFKTPPARLVCVAGLVGAVVLVLVLVFVR